MRISMLYTCLIYKVPTRRYILALNWIIIPHVRSTITEENAIHQKKLFRNLFWYHILKKCLCYAKYLCYPKIQMRRILRKNIILSKTVEKKNILSFYRKWVIRFFQNIERFDKKENCLLKKFTKKTKLFYVELFKNNKKPIYQ
jgi:hypothetical protein